MKKNAFTLIELLVIISILTILYTIVLVSYKNVRSNALDAKRKADIDSIKKAYETNYDPTANGGQGGYKPLQDSNFASGKIPTPPEGGSYIFFVGPGAGGLNSNTAYKVCATMNDNTSTCATSTQGDTTLITQINSLSNSTCDPTNSLIYGLIGYWKMDETTNWNNTAGEVKDSSGNNHNGVASGATVSTGKFGNAGQFDGNNDYINAGQVLPTDKTLPFTFSAWVKPAAAGAGSWRTIIGTNTSFAEIALSDANSPVFGQNGGGGLPWVVNTSFMVTNDSWYHIVGVFDGTKASLYVDNELKAGPTNYSFTNNHGVSLMGRYSITGGEWMNGLVDDARIYNRALSAGEVGLLYNSGNGCL
ncbi:hypothetical protein HY383_03695 [Candidatus Daviesbacteria bacterium]|nr:hypothetical protein [Candidatus Daviesbacteria bacterium]